MSTAIVTDSTSYLDQKYIEEYGITILPLSTTFSDGTYTEGDEITADAFYEKMATLDEIPTTSQPSSGLIKHALEDLAQTHDVIIVITLSGEISGTAQTVHMIGQDIKDAEVVVYDSGISCQPMAFLVQKAVEMVEDNAPLADIITALDHLKANTQAYFVVEDLNHLAKGGRLSQAGAMVGGLLKIKPLLYFQQGKIEVFEKIRTNKKTVARILELFEADYAKQTETLQVGVIGSPDNEMVAYLLDYMASNYSDVTVTLHHFGPVIGTHLGPDAYGFSWTVK